MSGPPLRIRVNVHPFQKASVWFHCILVTGSCQEFSMKILRLISYFLDCIYCMDTGGYTYIYFLKENLTQIGGFALDPKRESWRFLCQSPKSTLAVIGSRLGFKIPWALRPSRSESESVDQRTLGVIGSRARIRI